MNGIYKIKAFQNWHKMIRFLLKATELQDLPSDDVKDAGKMISLFKKKIVWSRGASS